MKKYVFHILFCLSLFVLTSSLSFARKNKPLKVKTMTGRGFDAGRNDTVVLLIQTFDKAGRLTGREQPALYCSEKWLYNKGKLVIAAVYCGESSGNGEYYYSYKGNTVRKKFSGAVYEYTQYDVLDKEGKIRSSSTDQKRYSSTGTTVSNQTRTTVSYQYVYNEKKQIIQEKKTGYSIYQDLDNRYKNEARDSLTTLFVYSPFDSLASRTKIYDTREEKDSIVYDPVSHRRMAEYFIQRSKSPDAGSDFSSSVLYEYSKEGTLRSKKIYLHCTASDSQQLSREEFYTGNLLLRSLEYDVCNGQIIQDIQYTYVFW